MNTVFLLLAAHHGAAMLPADVVCREYFAPLTLPVFLRKVGSGEIELPLVRMERSQKGAKLVHMGDLAAYIDRQRESALKELKALRS
jgi:hypothetical protein